MPEWQVGLTPEWLAVLLAGAGGGITTSILQALGPTYKYLHGEKDLLKRGAVIWWIIMLGVNTVSHKGQSMRGSREWQGFRSADGVSSVCLSEEDRIMNL